MDFADFTDAQLEALVRIEKSKVEQLGKDMAMLVGTMHYDSTVALYQEWYNRYIESYTAWKARKI